ncbi:restriction endonuclease subunit S [Actinomycetospora lemnae]|uniref:Restriction endonuclease subunit S n=1 Tax=Actinomycetospora lemnae TaxID=3019891 RepID=A0ABT5T0A9_9PSEU|nr:restriction endonuclease subunit S [Actinomycetospora sp. DW7H6]MDD7968434.1 restriction endonuclease subunit S [Actinomycetospora sp. DW7H6]
MNFTMVPFLDAVEDVSAGNRKIPRAEFSEYGRHPVVDQGQKLIAGYTDSADLLARTNGPIIVFGDHTRAFKYVDFPFAMGADGVKLLRCRDEFYPKFVYHYLRSYDLPSAGYSRHFKFLKRIEVPKPPLVEQHRIASILDKVDAIRSWRSKALHHLDLLERSIFHELVGDDDWRSVTTARRGKNSAGWEWVPLNRVARMATGHTPDRTRQGYWDGDIPWVSLPKIRELDGRMAVDVEPKVTEAGIANSSAVVLPAGTVCFSRTASVGFVTKLGRPMATSQDFHNWTPGDSLDSDYLMAALRFSRLHLLSASDGSIHRTIYQRVAERFHILLPPLEVQRDFAARKQRVDIERSNAQRSLAAIEEMLRSLQSRAFGGEL